MEKENKLRIKEAVENAKKNGYGVTMQTLAQKLWKNSTEATRYNNIHNIEKGTTKRISVDMINIICDECHCDPNFLFGYITPNAQRM